MALDADQRLKLEMILAGQEENPSALDNWETGFVASFAERYELYKDGVLISEKQWAILDRIYNNIVSAAEQA